MAKFQDTLIPFFETLDARLPLALLSLVSISAIRFRQDLREARWGFVDTEGPACDSFAVDQTAQRVINHASNKAGGISGLASLLGAASLPPEALAQVVTVLRLAQRLAVVYGFDPDDDRGQIAVWRALAAGLRVEMPDQGVLRMRASEIPGLVVASGSASAEMTRSVLAGVGTLVAGRAWRFVPFIGTGVSMGELRREMVEVGQRMQAVLRRLSDHQDAALCVEDVEEIR